MCSYGRVRVDTSCNPIARKTARRAAVKVSPTKEIAAVGGTVYLILSNGDVVERDLDALLWGPVFDPIRSDPVFFRRVRVEDGVLTWPGDVDLAPETVIWDGPTPGDPNARPPRFLSPRNPNPQIV
jgi:hypothetical protein